MAENSAIEWCDHTFNPWIGCTKVGPGCDHCYAENLMDTRYGRVEWGAGNPRSRTSVANWKLPLRWNESANRFAADMGRNQRVFCASLADVFDNEVVDDWRVDLFRLIAATPKLDWLLLTKRIGNVVPMLRTIMDALNREGIESPYWPWPNVWIGATIVNQAEADRDIPKLLEIPARVRWLSCEPLLGPLDLRERLQRSCCLNYRPGDYPDDPPVCCCDPLPALDWVVVGGESGKDARQMHPDWARDMRDQCAAARVPFLFKQWGEWLPDSQHPGMTGPIDQNGAIRVGKKEAGRLLDGVQHDGYPA